MNVLQPYKHIHFIGIGGAGMSAIAWVLAQRGAFKITGSDLGRGKMVETLEELGVTVYAGHHAKHVAGADLVVTSTAIPAENPERQAAERDGIPIWRRAKALAAIMESGRSIAVSGTHGKTTTTTLLGQMLAAAGLDPTALVGGHVHDFGGNARLGEGEWIVAEADESDASFLEMKPDRIIITNIEADHLDFYAGLEEVLAAFETFVGNLAAGGKIIACVDDAGVGRLLERVPEAGRDWELITYGLETEGADMRAEGIEAVDGGRGTRFTPIWRGEALEEVTLRVPGRHNVMNALGALAAGMELGAAMGPMREALGSSVGAGRRFEIKGTAGGVTVVDDYAHHPTEIAATLAAAREQIRGGAYRRMVAVFQPHRYSRTMHLAEDFGRALAGADVVVVTGVYAASEKAIPGVTGRLVFDAVETAVAAKGGGAAAHYFEKLDEAREFLRGELNSEDLLLTLGAGNVWQLGEALLGELGVGDRAKGSVAKKI